MKLEELTRNKLPTIPTSPNKYGKERYEWEQARAELEAFIKRENHDKGRSITDIAKSFTQMHPSTFITGIRSIGIKTIDHGKYAKLLGEVK